MGVFDLEWLRKKQGVKVIAQQFTGPLNLSAGLANQLGAAAVNALRASVVPKNEVKFDACLNQTFRFASEITSHPVETGLDISDHIHRSPRSLALEGVITSTPLKILGGLTFDLAEPSVSFDRPGDDRAIEIFEKLLSMWEKRQLVTVVTSFQALQDMAIEEIVVDREKMTSRSIEFGISLTQVTVADEQFTDMLVDLDSKLLGAGGTQDLGTQSTGEL